MLVGSCSVYSIGEELTRGRQSPAIFHYLQICIEAAKLSAWSALLVLGKKVVTGHGNSRDNVFDSQQEEIDH